MKIFENFLLNEPTSIEKYVYWKVRTDKPYYDISLYKIGMPKDEQNLFLSPDIQNRYFNNRKFIYLGLDDDVTSFYYGLEKDSFNNHKYKGEVDVTDEDIEEWKLNNIANKYNL